MGIKTLIPIKNEKNSQIVNFCDDRLQFDQDDFTILCLIHQDKLDLEPTSLVPN